MKEPAWLTEAIETARREGRILNESGPARTLEPAPTVEPQREDEFQAELIEYAQRHGWRVAHFRKSRTKNGWRTAVAADGKGWPDLVLVRDRVIFAELKSESGALSQEQKDWAGWLALAKAEAYVWRPADWATIVEALA